MRALGYTPCEADRDLWMKHKTTWDFKYYSYILVYVNDILVINADTKGVLHVVNMFLPLKADKNKVEPSIYLGSKLSQAKVGTEGVWAWGMSLSKYM